MKNWKIGLAAIAAVAAIAFLAPISASATALEVGGVAKSESVTITASIKTGTSAILKDTFGFFANTCTESYVAGKTESSFSEKPTGKLSELTFGSCDHTVTVHNPGKLYVEWTSGTNGTVYSEEAEVTSYSTIHGTHVNCKTGAGTPIGTLTGVASGQATMDINATLNCGPHLSSAKWTGTYTVTSPSGLGVVKEGSGGGGGGNADLEPGSKKFKFTEWQNFRIRNTGPGSLTINSVTIDVTKGTSSAFVVEDPNGCKGKTLSSGGTCEVTVTCWEWEAHGKLTVGTNTGSPTATLDSTP